MNFPAELRYTKEHEWTRLEADGTITIGITEYAQSELGDIVFVEMPSEGDHFDADDAFGSVEAVKTVSELFMPIAGTIVAINGDLDDSPESVNNDPYGDGWMIRIQPDSADDFNALMSADEYGEMVG